MEQQVANDLLAAYSSKNPIVPPRETIPGLDLAGAYRIQQLQEQQLVDAGRTVVGRKVGLTSLAMQQQLGVDSPDFGFFTDADLYEIGADIDVSRFIAPKVEPELAFKLARDLPAGATMEEAKAAIESVHLAVEIIDSRVRDWDIKLVDTVADNASFGAVVWDPTPLDVALEDLPKVSARMELDGEFAGEGEGSAVMGDPVAPLPWLANILHEQGTALNAGDIVISGSFCAAAAIAAGQKLVVDYGQHGSITLRFV